MNTRMKSIVTAAALAISLGACSNLNDTQERALSGGALGAAGGAAIGAVTGGSWIYGGLLGGAAGAAIGALTDEDHDLD